MNNKNAVRIVVVLVVLLLSMIVVWYVSSIAKKPDEAVGVMPTPIQRTVTRVEGVDAIDDLSDMVYNATAGVFYVASFDNGTIYVVGAKSKQIEGSIPVAFPHRLYLDTNNQLLYVSAGDDRLLKIDANTFVEISRAYVKTKPGGMVLDSKTSLLYVSTEYGNTVDVIDTKNMQVVSSVFVGKGPTDVALSANGEFLYVAEREAGTIGVISTQNRVYIKTIQFGGRPHRMYSVDTQGVVLILDQYTGALAILDSVIQRIDRKIDVVSLPSDMVVDTQRDKIYVTSFADNTIGVLDIKSEKMQNIIGLSQASFAQSTGLNNIAMVPGSNEVLVSNTNTGELHFVDIR